MLGLKILVLLVGEMNQPIVGRTLTAHRKAAVSFRDTALFGVFQLALTALRQLAAAPQPDTKLQDQVRRSSGSPHHRRPKASLWECAGSET